MTDWAGSLRRIVLLTVAALSGAAAVASSGGDSVVVHRLEVEAVPGAILHTNRFLRGSNPEVRTMNHSFVARVKYAFAPPEGSWQAAVYKGVYQGVGLAFHDFNPQLGNPVSLYVFQGAAIKTLSRRLSLNYEWDFGLTYGWHAYDKETNPDNHVIGSRMTAYIDVGLYLRWMLSRHWDLNVGATVTHYSNGNTSIPNAGLNVLGAKVSAAYYINREPSRQSHAAPPPLEHRWVWDLTLYGAWKRRGVETEAGTYPLPGTSGVAGFTLNPLYRLNRWLNVGASLDGSYDGGANISFGDGLDGSSFDEETGLYVIHPAWYRKVALGLSARAEFVMPYFTINLGIGHNLVNTHTMDMEGFYELLALKVGLARKAYLHIGYSIYDFYYPNNLMLGIGLHL